jgi:hypothetical protein
MGETKNLSYIGRSLAKQGTWTGLVRLSSTDCSGTKLNDLRSSLTAVGIRRSLDYKGSTRWAGFYISA